MSPSALAPPRLARSSDRVYEELKAMAVTYRFRPGERLNEVELARTLNVSRTPLREALNRLAAEGFLTVVNRGYACRPLDAKQIFNLYEVRGALERGIVRHACARALDDELLELEAFVIASKDRADERQATHLLGLDEQFHERIAVLSGNDEFVRELKAINGRIHFVRWIDMREGRRVHTQSQHLEIVAALKRRDVNRAELLVAEHIGRRLDQIVDVIKVGFAEIYLTGNSRSSSGDSQ